MSGRVVCSIKDINEGSAIGIELDDMALVAVKKRGQIYLYRNSCPHIGIRLEWLPDAFLNIDNSLIKCANHGALFTIEDGHCVSGPCSGQSLSAVAFTVIDQNIVLVPG